MSPDIAMCANEICPLNDRCYRFNAKPDKHWQTYGDFEPVDGECSYFIEPIKRSEK